MSRTRHLFLFSSLTEQCPGLKNKHGELISQCKMATGRVGQPTLFSASPKPMVWRICQYRAKRMNSSEVGGGLPLASQSGTWKRNRISALPYYRMVSLALARLSMTGFSSLHTLINKSKFCRHVNTFD